MKAKEILANNETAVIIFTGGRNLKINDDGTGESGVWRVKKNLQVQRVIIYCRDDARKNNNVWLGDFTQLNPSTVTGFEHRFAIGFEDLKPIGITEANWMEFTDTKQGSVYPIKYIR